MPDENSPRWRTWTLVAMAILGAATVAALVLALSEANHQRDRAAAAQSHSYDVMIVSRTLAGTIARAEAALGRYVISGDRRLGQLYSDNWRSATTQLLRLSKLTGDNDIQRTTTNRLRVAIADRGKELSDVALSTSYRQNTQALARYYKAREAPSLKAIDDTLNQLIDEERVLLNARTSRADQAGSRASAIAQVLSVFGMCIVLAAILLGVLTVHALSDRAAAQAATEAAELRADDLAEAVARATDELRTQEEKLRQSQKMEAIGQLTGGIAHDFNNMLAVVSGGLELARRHIDQPDLALRHVDSAAEGAARAAALTRQLLTFSREGSVRMEPIEMGALLRGMSDLLDRTLGDGITLHVLDTAGEWRVFGDGVQVENAVLNLAVNARDAMEGRGEMIVRATARALRKDEVGRCAAGDYVALSVTDTGVGMAPDVVDRVFEPFFTTKPVGKGTGLGLSQVFGLVRRMNGEVEIETAPGRGSTVTLYLPRMVAGQAAVAPGAPTPPVSRMEEPEAPVPSGYRVLLVEDDPRVLSTSANALEELGHRVIPCSDPLEAPAVLAAQGPVDLIVTDVLMPRQTGPEMIAGLLKRQPGLPVLYVTGFAGDASGTAGFGHHRVLRKPFTLAGLERAVAAAVQDRYGHDDPSDRAAAA